MTIVTGYLGSGKTTLINRLLADANGKRITVLVNDFGEISLDAELIENQDGDIIALANGCMCCQIGGDLYRTIDRILSLRDKIDHLVVETSGVADPSKISQIAAAEPELLENGTLALVDAANFVQIYEQAELRDTLLRQLQKADLILLTKIEMQRRDALSRVLDTINEIAPDCPLAAGDEEAISKMLATDGFKRDQDSPIATGLLKPHAVPFAVWNWQGKTTMNRERLIDLLQKECLHIYRCKGLVRFDDGSCGVVNKVGERIEISLSDVQFNQSVLTVIGPKADFDPNRFESAWKEAGVISQISTSAQITADG